MRRLLFLEESIRLVGGKQWGMRGYERAHASTRGFQARFSGGPLENKTMSTIDYKITLFNQTLLLDPHPLTFIADYKHIRSKGLEEVEPTLDSLSLPKM